MRNAKPRTATTGIMPNAVYGLHYWSQCAGAQICVRKTDLVCKLAEFFVSRDGNRGLTERPVLGTAFGVVEDLEQDCVGDGGQVAMDNVCEA